MSDFLICESKKCTGCLACKAVCPRNAIDFNYSTLGEYVPHINIEKCVSCNLCKEVCPVINTSNFSKVLASYAAQNIEKKDLLKSASGGVFQVLAKTCLKCGGVVYGAAWNERAFSDSTEQFVKHIRVNGLHELDKLQGSKYLQSYLGEVLVNVKEDLESGILVLFSGTPCQIASLKSYLLGKEYKNLITVDIICHGVCGEKIFKDFIVHHSKRKKIAGFSFRDKTNGWGLNCRFDYVTTVSSNQSKCSSAKFVSYYEIFLQGHLYRDNCYQCDFAQGKRISDITLGDFWGIEEEYPLLFSKEDIYKGISCVLVNSAKGMLFWEKTKDVKKFKVAYECIKRHNEQLNNPSNIGKYREKYIKCYQNGGYDAIERFFVFQELNKKEYVKHILVAFKNMIIKHR